MVVVIVFVGFYHAWRIMDRFSYFASMWALFQNIALQIHGTDIIMTSQ